ncbi:tetratricopeptide repeat protein [Photobacterium leiognathi]|uniref:type III secretion apparatus assembly chaperone SctY n=1 Tax=Photobacterium leiognathi TaxID=553611 RepID=UPI00273A3D55|nr:tetratricopeptide repeat protein [Photobacterium leiognathi]
MLQTKDVELLLTHAALQVQYQKYEQAITLLDALLEIEPQHHEARKILAVACLHSCRYTRAIRAVRKLIGKKQLSNQAGLWHGFALAKHVGNTK